MSNLKPSFFSTHLLFVLDHTTLDILDVNEAAVTFYGYSREEFCGMNIFDLGEKKDLKTLIKGEGSSELANEKIWVHYTKEGEKVYIQFTSHIFNYNGKAVKLATAHDITEQVTEHETSPSKFPQIELYRGDRALAEIVWNTDKTVIKWSNKAEKQFGWSKDEVVGNPDFFDSFIHEKELAQAYQLISDTVASKKKSYTIHGRVRAKDGTIRVSEWFNTMVYDEEGNLSSVHSMVQDISDRKESEYLFKALSEKSLVGVYLIQDGIFKYINPRFAEIFDYKKDEIEKKLGPLDLTHPDDREIVDENIQKRVGGEEKSIQYDFRCLTKGGKTIHVKVFGTRIEYLGKPAVVGTLLDITNSKLTFERYQASMENFEDLFDSISDAIYIQDKDKKFIKVNDAAVKLSGYDRDFLIGKTPDILAAPGKVNRNKTYNYFEKALNGTPQHFEQWGIRKNGEVFPEEVVLNPGTYFGEQVVITISRDISEEHKIKESEERFRHLFENAPFGIAMMDNHHEIKMVNRAFEDIFGYNETEIEGLDIDRLIIPNKHQDTARELSETNFEGNTFSVTATRKHKDGSMVEVLVCGVPVMVNNKVIAVFGIYMDITERKEAEEKIKKSLKEKEVLLAEIHHRVKNNLAVITGLLELQQYNTASGEAKNALRESQLRINSIALIHEKLYQNENLSEIAIDIYLRELIEIIVSSINSEETDIAVSVDSDSIFLTVNQAIPCGLILNELITNAHKHAFEGRERGEISIKLKKEADTFYLYFEDDGVGIPEDLNIENPTTLGITLIKTLSKQLRGTCGFENKEEGMRFSLQFELDE